MSRFMFNPRFPGRRIAAASACAALFLAAAPAAVPTQASDAPFALPTAAAAEKKTSDEKDTDEKTPDEKPATDKTTDKAADESTDEPAIPERPPTSAARSGRAWTRRRRPSPTRAA
ncbi:hypothetical protein WU86_01330 [Corynebacterium xerosis]|nr:hypothetical protein WU86_01330 [Corynebacterium xerosis]